MHERPGRDSESSPAFPNPKSDEVNQGRRALLELGLLGLRAGVLASVAPLFPAGAEAQEHDEGDVRERVPYLRNTQVLPLEQGRRERTVHIIFPPKTAVIAVVTFIPDNAEQPFLGRAQLRYSGMSYTVPQQYLGAGEARNIPSNSQPLQFSFISEDDPINRTVQIAFPSYGVAQVDATLELVHDVNSPCKMIVYEFHLKETEGKKLTIEELQKMGRDLISNITDDLPGSSH